MRLVSYLCPPPPSGAVRKAPLSSGGLCFLWSLESQSVKYFLRDANQHLLFFLVFLGLVCAASLIVFYLPELNPNWIINYREGKYLF